MYKLRKLQINTSYERVLFYICLHTILRMLKYVNHSRYITKNSVLLTYLKNNNTYVDISKKAFLKGCKVSYYICKVYISKKKSIYSILHFVHMAFIKHRRGSAGV